MTSFPGMFRLWITNHLSNLMEQIGYYHATLQQRRGRRCKTDAQPVESLMS
jgi:hypothetical protein